MKLLNLNIQLFASASASATIYSNGSSQYGYDIAVSWEEQSGYDAEKNTTTIKGYASLYGKNVNFSTSTGGVLYFDWYDNKTKTWSNKASKTITATTRGTTYKAEATFSVEHNADGSLKGKARVRWDKTGTNQWIPNDGSKETSEQTLTTIPRATKIGNHSGTIGTNLPITWSRASNSFTHTLVIKFGSKTFTYPGLTTGKDWTPPPELYSQMSGKNGTGSLTLTTYSGSNTIGSAQTATLTLNAKQADVEPQIGTSTFKDTNSAMVGITNGTDVIVANKSLTQINFTFSTRGYAKAKTLLINNVSRTIPTGVVRSNDASITDYAVSVDLGTVKSNSFTISVTDTREYPANNKNSTPTIDSAKFIDYIPLDVSSSFKRIAPTTGEVGMTFNGNFWEGNFGKVTNSLSISYKYKKKEDTTYSNLITLVKDTDYKISNNKYYSGTGSSQDVIELEALFDYKSIYDVQFFVSDAVTTLPTINLVITKGIPIFWWNGEKVVVNGELYVADENGENTSLVPKVKNEYSTSNTDTYSCNYINSKTSYIEGRVYYGQSVAKETVATIDYRQTYRIGTGMSLSNGVITINDDNVKIISINACVQNTTWTSGGISMYVFKNGANQATSVTSNTINGILSAAIPVSKGEQIEIKIYGSVAIKLENSPWSYLNVTAI